MAGSRNRRSFTAEFKAEAVRLALSGEKSQSQTARDLGLGESTLHGWIRNAEKHREIPPASGQLSVSQLEEENRLLREQNRRLQMERDILKKATAFFATESK
jgi:transposase